jgi:hypothetical protein
VGEEKEKEEERWRRRGGGRGRRVEERGRCSVDGKGGTKDYA